MPIKKILTTDFWKMHMFRYKKSCTIFNVIQTVPGHNQKILIYGKFINSLNFVSHYWITPINNR